MSLIGNVKRVQSTDEDAAPDDDADEAQTQMQTKHDVSYATSKAPGGDADEGDDKQDAGDKAEEDDDKE